MSEWQPSGADVVFGLILTALVVLNLLNHNYEWAAFWGFSDLQLSLTFASKRIAHAIQERDK